MGRRHDHHGRPPTPAQESRGAQAHEDYPESRRRQLDEAHAGLGATAAASVRLDYRPVKMQTLTNEVSVIPPKKRVY